jgi:hypothetical protein
MATVKESCAECTVTDSIGQDGFELENEASAVRVGTVLGAFSTVGGLIPVTVVEPMPHTEPTLTSVTTWWTSFTPSVVFTSISIRYACFFEA